MVVQEGRKLCLVGDGWSCWPGGNTLARRRLQAGGWERSECVATAALGMGVGKVALAPLCGAPLTDGNATVAAVGRRQGRAAGEGTSAGLGRPRDPSGPVLRLPCLWASSCSATAGRDASSSRRSTRMGVGMLFVWEARSSLRVCFCASVKDVAGCGSGLALLRMA